MDSAQADEGEIPLTVAAVCMNVKTDTAANLDSFTAYISEASAKGAKLIVFPEIALQQNPGWGSVFYQPSDEELRYVGETAETIPGPSTDVLVRLAEQYDIAVIFGMTERDLDGRLYNTSVFLESNGIVGKHRKTRLVLNERSFWRQGSDIGLVESSFGAVGLIICAEAVTGLGRTLAEAGAGFLVTISASSSGGGVYDTVSRRNAVEASRWHIMANQVGTAGYSTVYGHSRIVDPNGLIVADTGAEEGMVIATINIPVHLTRTVDLNRDGIVDCADTCIMVHHWHTHEPSCDIAPPFGDGVVDALDLIVLTDHLFTYPGAMAYWTLDETEGNTAYDSVGDYHGSALGAPVWQSDGGMVAGALQFDGVDDYISTDPVLDPVTGVFSVFAWVKDGTPGQVVLSQNASANWLYADPIAGYLATQVTGSGWSARPLLSQTAITDGNWHRIGLVCDGSHRTLYVDDLAVAQDTQDGLLGADSGLHIGAGKTMELGSYWSGLIDDIRIYRRAVTP